jgi:glycine/D-amino acid oxidase-like deaminating enzyme
MIYDALVVGGGILGFSTAYHIKIKDPSKKVLVIDKNSSSGQGNTAKSEGAFRNVFASMTNYVLADSTIDWLNHVQEEMEYDLKVSHIGYLWLFNHDQYEKLESVFRLMKERGIVLKFLKKDEIKKAIPDIVTDFDPSDDENDLMELEDIDIGVYAPKCGSVDADALCRFYEAEFEKLGGETCYNTKARSLLVKPDLELGIPGEPFIWQKKKIVGVDTGNCFIYAKMVILATGAWSEELLNPVGIDPMMRPKKRQLFVFKDQKLDSLHNLNDLNVEGVLPLTILPKCGIYLKAEITEKSVWLGCADNFGRAFTLEDEPEAEEDYYLNDIYHVVTKYFPCLKDIRPITMWAGQYAINSMDLTPIVTPLSGLIYVGAASGSGIMKSDAIGRVAASLYYGEEYAELYGGYLFKVSDLSLPYRNVEKETFVI